MYISLTINKLTNFNYVNIAHNFPFAIYPKQRKKMKNNEEFENRNINRQELFLLVTPILGFFPAMWILFRQKASLQHRAVSRLIVTLTLIWLLGNILLQLGTEIGESGTITLLLINSLLTTSYFIISFGLMVRIWKRQPLWLPGISQIAEKVVGKHL